MSRNYRRMRLAKLALAVLLGLTNVYSLSMIDHKRMVGIPTQPHKALTRLFERKVLTQKLASVFRQALEGNS